MNQDTNKDSKHSKKASSRRRKVKTFQDRLSEKRGLMLRKAVHDGLDRVGVTVLALSFIGGIIAPLNNRMEWEYATAGVLIGILSIVVGGYQKQVIEQELELVQELLEDAIEDES